MSKLRQLLSIPDLPYNIVLQLHSLESCKTNLQERKNVEERITKVGKGKLHVHKLVYLHSEKAAVKEAFLYPCSLVLSFHVRVHTL